MYFLVRPLHVPYTYVSILHGTRVDTGVYRYKYVSPLRVIFFFSRSPVLLRITTGDSLGSSPLFLSVWPSARDFRNDGKVEKQITFFLFSFLFFFFFFFF